MGQFRFAVFGNWRLTRLTACLGGVFALLIGVGVSTAAPAMAAVTVTRTTIEHVCEQFGNDVYGNQAIVCTDLIKLTYTSSAGFLGYEVTATSEAICENSKNQIVQCANITVANESASGDGYTSPVSSTTCGHSHGNCPAGRFYLDNAYTLDNGPEQCVGEVWAVTLAGPATAIELPKSATTIDLPADFGTPHATVGSC
jgi:hypothetical protein